MAHNKKQKQRLAGIRSSQRSTCAEQPQSLCAQLRALVLVAHVS